jgi:replicative DNA helicase
LARKGSGKIFLDYLQLCTGETGKSSTRDQELGGVCRALKGSAMKYQIPVTAGCQFGRKVEERKPARGMLSDLRESGNIEQDANLVLSLYRPEYYGADVDENGENTKGKCELGILKYRGGALLDPSGNGRLVNTRYDPGLHKFYDWGEAEQKDWKPIKPGKWRHEKNDDFEALLNS